MKPGITTGGSHNPPESFISPRADPRSSLSILAGSSWCVGARMLFFLLPGSPLRMPNDQGCCFLSRGGKKPGFVRLMGSLGERISVPHAEASALRLGRALAPVPDHPAAGGRALLVLFCYVVFESAHRLSTRLPVRSFVCVYRREKLRRLPERSGDNERVKSANTICRCSHLAISPSVYLRVGRIPVPSLSGNPAAAARSGPMSYPCQNGHGEIWGFHAEPKWSRSQSTRFESSRVEEDERESGTLSRGEVKKRSCGTGCR